MTSRSSFARMLSSSFLIGDWSFDAPDLVMLDNQVSRLYVDWASTVDTIEHTYGAKKAILPVFFGMISSPRWFPHLVSEKCNLLEYFISVPDDSQFPRKCINNPWLMNTIRGVKNPTAIVLWLAILWLKYKELTPQVLEWSEEVTKERAQRRRMDLNRYLSVVDCALRKAEDALVRYNMQPTNPTDIALRRKNQRPPAGEGSLPHPHGRSTLISPQSH